MFSSFLNFDELKFRIGRYRTLVQRGLSDEECLNEFSSIFIGSMNLCGVSHHYAAGITFFRARVIPDDDTKIPLQTIRSVADAWEPPRERITVQGRLNAIGQSILYCCPEDWSLAIDEARARDANHVAMMVYRAKRRITVAVMGDYPNSDLPRDEFSKLFYEFLDEEFSQVILRGGEKRYSITRMIAEGYFNFPEQDAWCYRSVQSPTKFNVAFLPEKQRECLELSGVLICDLRWPAKDVMCVKLAVDFDPLTGVARYHEIGSPEQKRLFPEIEQLRDVG